MNYLIDIIMDVTFLVRELIKLSYVVITSPFAIAAAGLLFLGNSHSI